MFVYILLWIAIVVMALAVWRAIGQHVAGLVFYNGDLRPENLVPYYLIIIAWPILLLIMVAMNLYEAVRGRIGKKE